MYSIMELDGRRYSAIDDSGYPLPQDLHQANTSEVDASPLGDHHHHLSETQHRELSSPEGRLYDGDNLLPVSWVSVFLFRLRAKPHPEVFGPYDGWASSTM